MKTRLAIVATLTAAALLTACATPHHDEHSQPAPVMVFNITSGPTEDAHSVTMAMQLAGHCLDAGREVVLFFNVRGVTIPTEGLSPDLSFKDEPIKELLAGLIEKGAELQVCPHCMQAMSVEEEDLIEGAEVTNADLLFSRLGPNSIVFTY